MRYVRPGKLARGDHAPVFRGYARFLHVPRSFPSREQPCLPANRLVIQRPEVRMRLCVDGVGGSGIVGFVTVGTLIRGFIRRVIVVVRIG